MAPAIAAEAANPSIIETTKAATIQPEPAIINQETKTVTLGVNTADEAAKIRAQLRSNPIPTDLKTSPQHAVVPFTIIEGPAAWKGADIRDKPEQFIYHVTEQDISELDAAVRAVEASGVDHIDKVYPIPKEAYDFPTLGPKLRELAKQSSSGRGFQLLRGIPVERYNKLQLVILWWGIGRHIGRILNINKFGQNALVDHIIDETREPVEEKYQRGRTNSALAFHSDQFATDIIGLLSIGKPAEGGEAAWVSSVTIHNELLRAGRKDLVEALTTNNWWIYRSGYGRAETYPREGAPDEELRNRYFTNVQPFSYDGGRFASVFSSSLYTDSQSYHYVPRLTPLQLEAIKAVDALAQDPDLHIKRILEPGDVQLLNNITQFHGRNAFVDNVEADKKRHLLRWWVDSTGRSVEDLRAAGPPVGFGQRLTDPAGGWPQADFQLSEAA